MKENKVFDSVSSVSASVSIKYQCQCQVSSISVKCQCKCRMSVSYFSVKCQFKNRAPCLGQNKKLRWKNKVLNTEKQPRGVIWTRTIWSFRFQSQSAAKLCAILVFIIFRLKKSRKCIQQDAIYKLRVIEGGREQSLQIWFHCVKCKWKNSTVSGSKQEVKMENQSIRCREATKGCNLYKNDWVN